MQRLSGTALLAAILAGFPCTALAHGAFEGFARVSDVELAHQRGGFISRNGVEMSFGVEEFALVDGVPIYRRMHNDVCACGAGEGALAGSLFRMDPAGTSITPFSSDGWVTVMQNSVSGRAISHFTVLDIAIGGATVDRTMAQRVIDSGIVDVLSQF